MGESDDQHQELEDEEQSLHSMIEMSECGKNYQIFVFKSDNQRFMSRNIIVFGNQIDNNT